MPVKDLSETDTVIINGEIFMKVSDRYGGIIEAEVEEVMKIDREGKKPVYALVLKDITEGDFGRVKLFSPGTFVRLARINVRIKQDF